jgi:hypothetical protein
MAPTQLVARCRRLWEAYDKKPLKRNLVAVTDHLERMKASKSIRVKNERARALRAVNREWKLHGWKRPGSTRKKAKRRRRRNPDDGNGDVIELFGKKPKAGQRAIRIDAEGKEQLVEIDAEGLMWEVHDDGSKTPIVMEDPERGPKDLELIPTRGVDNVEFELVGWSMDHDERPNYPDTHVYKILDEPKSSITTRALWKTPAKRDIVWDYSIEDFRVHDRGGEPLIYYSSEHPGSPFATEKEALEDGVDVLDWLRAHGGRRVLSYRDVYDLVPWHFSVTGLGPEPPRPGSKVKRGRTRFGVEKVGPDVYKVIGPDED